jgi:chromosome segregation ATPase
MFVAVASAQPIELEAFSVVQLPYRSLSAAGEKDGDALRRARSAEQAARNKLAELELELATERQAVATRDTKLRESETRLFARDAELSALRQELQHKNQQLEAHEASIAELNVKLKQGVPPEDAAAAASELSALEAALQERGEHLRQLERELREAERVGKELVRQLPAASPDSAAAQTQPLAADSEALAQKLAKTQADLIATRWALEAAVRRSPAAETPEA